MRRAATLALAFLAVCTDGCALTANELQSAGELEEEFRSERTVAAALECIRQTAPQKDARLLVQTQAGAALIYVGGHLWGIATATPMGSGSHISVRVQPILMHFERNLTTSAVKGC